MTIFKKWARDASEYQVMEIAEEDVYAGFGYLGNKPPTAEEFNWLIQYLTLGIISSGRFWQPSTAYVAGQILYPYDLSKSFKLFECITAGTSGTAEPIWPEVGYETSDGQASWVVRDIRDARKLQQSRKINNVDFDGSKDITVNDGEPGDIMYTAAAVPPSNYLIADGTAISRVAYAALFAKIGTIHGAGDGNTTFNIPDLRGVFVRGLDGGRGIDADRGLGTYQDDEFKSHTHAIDVPTDSYGYGDMQSITKTDNHDESLKNDAWTSDPTGGSETRPKNVALLACIRYR